MKKLQTREVRERKTKRNQIIIGVVMIVLMVLATGGYAFMSLDPDSNSNQDSKKTTYNGIDFYKQENLWVTQINSKVFAFSYLPDELSDVEITLSKNVQSFVGQPLYVVNSKRAREIIGANLLPEFAERVSDACIENETSCIEEDLPVKNCKTNNVVVFRSNTEETKIFQEEGCIIIQGDIAKGTDKFLQSILGIA